MALCSSPPSGAANLRSTLLPILSLVCMKACLAWSSAKRDASGFLPPLLTERSEVVAASPQETWSTMSNSWQSIDSFFAVGKTTRRLTHVTPRLVKLTGACVSSPTTSPDRLGCRRLGNRRITNQLKSASHITRRKNEKDPLLGHSRNHLFDSRTSALPAGGAEFHAISQRGKEQSKTDSLA